MNINGHGIRYKLKAVNLMVEKHRLKIEEKDRWINEVKLRLEEECDSSDATKQKLIKLEKLESEHEKLLVDTEMYRNLESEVVMGLKKEKMEFESDINDVKRILLECGGDGDNGKFQSRKRWTELRKGSRLKINYFDCAVDILDKESFYRHVGVYHMAKPCVLCGGHVRDASGPSGNYHFTNKENCVNLLKQMGGLLGIDPLKSRILDERMYFVQIL